MHISILIGGTHNPVPPRGGAEGIVRFRFFKIVFVTHELM